MTPRFASCWPELAWVAADLLAQREASYPAAVAADKLTQVDADHGLRVIRAVAEQWRRIDAQEPLPDPLDRLGAAQQEMAGELATAAARAQRRAFAAPDDPHIVDYAACVAALAWHQQPAHPGFTSSRISFIHSINIELWARRQTQPLAA